MFDESKHPRDTEGKFTKNGGTKEYRQNTKYEDILADSDVSDLERTLYEGYLDKIHKHPNYAKSKELEKEINELIKKDIDAYKEDRKLYDTDIVKFVDDVLKGKKKETETYIVGKISNRLRKDIENLTGEKLNAENITVSAQQIIQHIDARHGKNGKHDNTLADISEYGFMNAVLNNYTEISLSTRNGKPHRSHYKNKYNEPALKIVISKKMGAKYYVVEAITDTKNGNDIKTVSMYYNYELDKE